MSDTDPILLLVSRDLLAQLGTRTEDGWVGNSIDGRECNGCGEDWPCSATRLRLIAIQS